MRILLTGATGFIGRVLASALVKRGHNLVILTRDATRASTLFDFSVEAFAWSGESPPPPEAALRNVDAVIHLAGER